MDHDDTMFFEFLLSWTNIFIDNINKLEAYYIHAINSIPTSNCQSFITRFFFLKQKRNVKVTLSPAQKSTTTANY